MAHLSVMEHKTFGHMSCPIARSVDRVGEWWSILIMRDAFYGVTRFGDFEKSLGIAPNMLTRRLNALVATGLMDKRRYSEKPLRHEYILTDVGRDFRPVILSLLAWGNRNFAPEGPSVQMVDVETGMPAIPVLVDKVSGRLIEGGAFRVVAGPAADERMRRRLSSNGAL